MFRDYANGEIGDDGIHDIDMATWGLGVDTLAQADHRSRRTNDVARSCQRISRQHECHFEYPDGRLLVYENYPFTTTAYMAFDNGNVFYGTEGYMVFSRRGAFSVFLGQKGKPGPTEGKELRGQRGYEQHMAEFLDAVRHRTPTGASPEVAHRSCALVHLGDIAEQVQGRLDFDPATQRFVDCEEANKMLTKKYRRPFGLPDLA